MSGICAIRHLMKLAPESVPPMRQAVFFAAAAAFFYPIPIFMAWMVFRSLQNGTSNSLLALFFAIATIAIILVFICRARCTAFAHKASFIFGTKICAVLMDHLGKIPLHWFSNKSTGELKKILKHDIELMEYFIAHNISDSIACVLLPILCICILFFINTTLSFVILSIIIIAIYIHYITFKLMKNTTLNDEYFKTVSILHSDTIEFIHGMQDIKIFNRTNESYRRMDDAIKNFKKIQIDIQKVFLHRCMYFLTITAMAFVITAIAGAYLYKSGYIQLDIMLLFIMVGWISFVPLTRMPRFITFLWKAGVGYHGMKQLLDVPEEVRGDRKYDSSIVPDLRVENLSVNYDDKPVLKNISFEASASAITAIVGFSGSGKSTLVAALAGMERLSSGRITVGGIDLQEFASGELGKLMALVFQNPFIFSGTVRENLCLGLDNPSQEQIEAAARMVQCDKFIKSLPNGYDTRIGSGGEVHLSGGQRQRLALARMALHNAPVVLLDEASAFVDPESEEAIQKGLSNFLKNKTVIVVAHRLSSIAHANNIIVLDKGAIAESGTHAELLQQNGVYSRMWDAWQTTRSWELCSPSEKNSSGGKDA